VSDHDAHACMHAVLQGLNGLDSDMRSDLNDIVDALSNSLPTVTAQVTTAVTQSNGTAAIKLDSVSNTATKKLTTAAYAQIMQYLDENHKGWQVQCSNTPCKQQNKATGDITWVCTEHYSSNNSVQQVATTVPLEVSTTSNGGSTHAASLLALNSASKTRYLKCHIQT
jgi:hypothetical protein